MNSVEFPDLQLLELENEPVQLLQRNIVPRNVVQELLSRRSEEVMQSGEVRRVGADIRRDVFEVKHPRLESVDVMGHLVFLYALLHCDPASARRCFRHVLCQLRTFPSNYVSTHFVSRWFIKVAEVKNEQL